MAKESISPYTINVLNKKPEFLQGKTTPGCDRHKRWLILQTLDKQLVRDYYAATRKSKVGQAQKNNVLAAVDKGIITITAPKS